MNRQARHYQALSYWKRFLNLNLYALIFVLPIVLLSILLAPFPYGLIPFIWFYGVMLLLHHFGRRTQSVQVLENSIEIKKRSKSYQFDIGNTLSFPFIIKGKEVGIVLKTEQLRVAVYEKEFSKNVWKGLKQELGRIPLSNESITASLFTLDIK